MEESAILTAISTLGFPACVSMYLLFRYSQVLEKISENSAAQTRALEAMKDEIKEMKNEIRAMKEEIHHESVH